MLPPAALLTDIEGTTTPIAFVRDVLFPYARERLPDWLAAHVHEPKVAGELALVRSMVPGQAELTTLLHWMDQDAKAAPLKTLQGWLWDAGYDDGTLRGELYPDVAPALRRWNAGGLRLHVYSSGSVEAQKLIFGHSAAGDLTGLFAGFFDTRVGAKREQESYSRLSIAINLPPAEIVFLSDAEAELDAAAAAGLRTCQIVRTADGTVASDRHATASDFPEAAKRMGLPHVA